MARPGSMGRVRTEPVLGEFAYGMSRNARSEQCRSTIKRDGASAVGGVTAVGQPNDGWERLGAAGGGWGDGRVGRCARGGGKQVVIGASWLNWAGAQGL